jgi:hypothetical protein
MQLSLGAPRRPRCGLLPWSGFAGEGADWQKFRVPSVGLQAVAVVHAVSNSLPPHTRQAHDGATCISPFRLVEWTTLPVDFTEDNIERAENCRYVSKHVSFAQKVHCLKVRKGWCANLALIWSIGSI